MSAAILALFLVAGPFALADELDDYDRSVVSGQQVELAKELPQTVIVRVSKSDPSKIEAIHLKEQVPPGTKVDFEELAQRAEKTTLQINAENELDAVSSTSSWRFGFYGGVYGGYGRPYYRPYRNYYNSYYRPYYGNYGYRRPYYGYYGNRYVYRSAWAYPSYYYGGYRYNYAPYYGYSDPYYNYAYCNWY